MANQDAYLAHIVAQMHQNVAFLVSQNHIAQADADIITSRLPAVQPENHSSVSGRGAVASALHAVTPSAPAPPTRRMVPPPPPTTTSAVQARAIWAYSGVRTLVPSILCPLTHTHIGRWRPVLRRRRRRRNCRGDERGLVDGKEPWAPRPFPLKLCREDIRAGRYRPASILRTGRPATAGAEGSV